MTSPDTRGRTESQARTWSRAPGYEVARRATMPAILPRRASVGRFKIVTQHAPAVSFGVSGGGYKLEMEALGALDAEIVEVTGQSEDEFIAAARDADALIAKGRPLTRKIIESLQRCKVIALGSVGADTVDVAAATARGIPVTNVPDTFIEEVADHAMMLILATFRRLTTMDRMVGDGRWKEGRPLLSRFPRLMGQTLGLTELLQRSDIVSMHAPATADAHHLLTEHHFRQMKPEAIFINTGRGPTVDEPALIRALQEGWIAAAGLDVLEQEPPKPDNPLLRMDNVILSPHVASASARMDPERRRRVGQEIALVLSGRWPRSCVNPSVLEKTGLIRWQPYSMERGPGG